MVAPLGNDNASILQNKQLQQASGKRRQLSNFNIKQRLSQGQVVQATLKQQARQQNSAEQSPQQRGYSSHVPNKDTYTLVQHQNKQH